MAKLVYAEVLPNQMSNINVKGVGKKKLPVFAEHEIGARYNL